MQQWVLRRPFLPFLRKSNKQPLQGYNSQPKASVSLPPETLDNILEHIPTDNEGRPSLIACALVATWWMGPSQRRLFSSVLVDNKDYGRWADGVVLSGSGVHLEYVRALQHHCSSLETGTGYLM